MKNPDLLRRVAAVDCPLVRRSVCSDRNLARKVLSPILQPVGVEFHSLFCFVIHWLAPLAGGFQSSYENELLRLAVLLAVRNDLARHERPRV
jgi:hypothetical protein